MAKSNPIFFEYIAYKTGKWKWNVAQAPQILKKVILAIICLNKIKQNNIINSLRSF